MEAGDGAGDGGEGGEAGEAGAKVGGAGKPGGCDEAPDDIPGACFALALARSKANC